MQILICDDDASFQLAVKHLLKSKHECRTAYNADEALAVIRNHPIDVLLLDVQMRTPDEGLKYLPALRDADPRLAIVMSTANRDFATVREAMRLGANDFVPKDFDPEELIHTIDRVLERRRLAKRNEQQDFEASEYQKRHVMIGESAAMKEIGKLVERYRASRAPVLITGETGTGKELVARQLRERLPDGSLAPFVAVDSSTIQSALAESLLFGHEKGAFTGAERATAGVFEQADGGSVYFDEIGNMPMEIQSKLLRVLQEKEITRLGSTRAQKLDFRVIAATNLDLEAAAREGRFKPDLLQRLNVLPIALAPLRSRAEDVPALLAHFAPTLEFTEDAVSALRGYAWPGNVRELGNLCSQLLATAESDEIDLADLPPRIRDAAGPPTRGKTAESADFYSRVGAFEKELLAREYKRVDGNVSRLALELGMDRSHLYTKLREHGLHAKDLARRRPSSDQSGPRR